MRASANTVKEHHQCRGVLAWALGSRAPDLLMSQVMVVTHSHCLYLAVTQLPLL